MTMVPLPVRPFGPGAAAASRREQTDHLLREAASETSPQRREDLLEEVIRINIPVARALAARYRNRGQAMEELEQVACVGLVRAVRSFDPDRGADLLVLAVPTILGEIKRYFRDHAWDVRPPRRLQELRPRLRSEEERLTQELGSRPGARELAAALGCDESEVRELAVADLGVEYLDRPAADGTSVEPMHQLPTADRGFEQVEASATIGPAFRRLSDQDRRILALRFVEEYTQQQIADELGVSQMQVSRLLRRILNELRAAIGELDERRDREFARPVPAKSA